MPPKLLPQLADTADLVVWAGSELDGLVVAVLAPNRKGLENAVAAGAHKVTIPFSMSETHSIRNVHKTHAEMLEEIRCCATFLDELADDDRPKFDVALATAFGCTIEGPVPEDRVARLAASAVELGADEVVLADTTGVTAPLTLVITGGFGRVPLDPEAFERHINAEHLPHAVMIDCTAEQSVADRYAGWLERGIHVITPNKKAGSGPIAEYEVLKSLGKHGSSHFFYETTVGAALPIISTLQDLIDTGDRVHSVQGIFSGTLAYLFNVFDGSRAFSEIVRDANDRGYTEPDPRDDLSGMDVARKAVILAREAGLDLELDDIEVQSLVPADLAAASVDEFLERLSDFDPEMAARLDSARAEDRVLRYVADVDIAAGRASVELKSFPPDHPFANISLTDNIVQFVTRRYSDNPLIIRGPGAGPDVTAAGIFADLLRLCSMLSASGD